MTDYLLLPRTHNATSLASSAPERLNDVVRTVTGQVEDALRDRIPGAALHTCYARGSAVSGRLDLANRYWVRTQQLIGTQDLLGELAPQYGTEAVEAATFAIEKVIAARLMQTDRPLGAAKLLFRIRRPDEEMLRPGNLPIIEAFVDEVALLTRGVRPAVIAAFQDVRPEPDLSSLRTEAARVSGLLGEAALGQTIIDNLADIQALAVEAGCFSPVLPLSTTVTKATADLLRLSLDEAALALKLLRFATLTCHLDRPQSFSDFSLKTLTVISTPGDDAVIARMLATATAVLDNAKTSTGLQAFFAACPNATLSVRSCVAVLPRALCDIFQRLDRADKLDMLTWYQVDRGIFEHNLTALLERYGFTREPIDVAALAARVRILTTRDAGSGWDELEPDNVERLRRRLREAVEDPTGSGVRKCGNYLRKVPRFDFRYDAGLLD